MKTVCLEIDGKRYEKREPLIKDWLALQKHFEVLLFEKKMTSDKAIHAIAVIVGAYIGVSKDEILTSNLKPKAIVKAYHGVMENINECVSGIEDKPYQHAPDRSRTITENLMAIAKELLFRHGRLPDEYFKQTLQSMLSIMSFMGKKESNRVNFDELGI